MNINSIILTMIGAFFFAVGLIAYAIKVILAQKHLQKERLHRMIEVTVDREDLEEKRSLLSVTEKLGDSILALPFAAKIMRLLPQRKFTQSSELKPAHLVVINLAMFFVAYNVAQITHFSYPMSLLILIAVEAGALYFIVKKQKKLRDLVEENLAGILDTMARVYKVHPDLRVAIQEASAHIREPEVKEKFDTILKLSRFGYTIEESLALLARELKSSDLEFVVSSINLNKPLGGNLSSQFEHIAEILRQRKATTSEINNVMFQNKVSSIIAAAFVPIIMIVSFATNPETKKHLVEDPTGRIIFIISMFWWIIGLFLIRRATRVKI